MNYSQLTLNQAPPIAVPMRFFLTAPLFGAAAAVALLLAGPAVLEDRWLPATLGITHLLTLGMITMTMFGALLQLLPVLAGSTVPRVSAVSMVLHVLLVAGTVLLASGLWADSGFLVRSAVPVLLATFSGFIVAVGYSLARSRSAHPAVWAMRAAWLALLVTVVLGLILGVGHGWDQVALYRSLTDLHLTWGVLGWVGLLVMGVAYQVVPMFQITPEYPHWLRTFLVPVLFIALVGWSLAAAVEARLGPTWHWLRSAVAGFLAAGIVVFAVATLVLQARRRRRRTDPTLSLWRLAMGGLLLCVLLWCIHVMYPAAFPTRLPLLLGVSYIVGFAVSVINGMLYKIVPFLVWLNSQRLLQERNQWRGQVPSMGEIIPVQSMWLQYRVQVAAAVLMLAAAVWPRVWTYPAGAVLAASLLMLWANLLRGVFVYRRFKTVSGDCNDAV